MAGYIGNAPVPQATQTRDTFTATAGQTSFATSGYTPNYLDVYLNGVKLPAEDYTATNGSDVVLDTGAALNDIVEVVAFSTFEVVDQAFTGDTSVTNAGTALTANRTGSDGVIVDLQKDGSTVGSIGGKGGAGVTLTSIGSNAVGMGYYSEGNNILPWSQISGAERDAAIDLGRSSGRFKDLYLSGGVYLGGTGSANHFDDYEEGTWTPSVYLSYNPNGRTITGSTCTGRYTKVGNLVQCEFDVSWSGISGSGAYNVGVSGLPFTKASDITVSNGSGRSGQTGNMFQMENVNSNVVQTLRKYDNGSPNTVDQISCFIIYRSA